MNVEIDLKKAPTHVGIIMDGNGRWALKRGKSRTEGHLEGAKTAKKIVKRAAELGIKYLSLYTFSTENWKRAQEEVSFLMSLIKRYLKKEYDFYRENKIRVVHSGRLEDLPSDIVAEIERVIKDTADFNGLTVNLAINYGGRDEIVRAIRRIVESSEESSMTIEESTVKRFLDHPEIPDPDLIIRTGGELRLSNFLLWESAYSELYFSEKLWPEWNGRDLDMAIADYQGRERRFGGAK